MDTVLHDRYIVKGSLGSGGMSRVYLCVDNHINKLWAVKKIKCCNDNLRLIESEINTLKALDYYLFPRITDAWIEEGYYYIVSDYIEGTSLDKIISKGQGLSESVAVKYAMELIRALKFLHSESPPILYLDMKPSNIMITKDGSIKVIDFGIAQSITLKSRCYGTAGYAAPEQYVKGEILDEKTDIYSFGVTFYSLLTGSNPDSNHYKQIKLVKKNPGINKQIKSLILDCIQVEKEKRPELYEVENRLANIVGKIKLYKVLLLAVVISLSVVSVTTYLIKRDDSKNKYQTAAKDMIELSSAHVENGEYTREGIRIICGYLDGNFLDDETKEAFTYEVARNFFEVQRDYSNAKRYFEKVNFEKYPDAEFLLDICNEMTRFDMDEERISKSIERFKDYNKIISDKDKQRKNEELVNIIQKRRRDE